MRRGSVDELNPELPERSSPRIPSRFVLDSFAPARGPLESNGGTGRIDPTGEPGRLGSNPIDDISLDQKSTSMADLMHVHARLLKMRRLAYYARQDLGLSAFRRE